MLSQVPIYKIRVHYKGGTTEEFEVLAITVNTLDGSVSSIEWTTPEGQVIRPLAIGANDIASVWQVGVRNG